MELNTGIARQDREAIAAGLSRLLADSYTLYLKTHNFHWNVTGPQFNTLHQMFEGQYTELAAAVDEIAERIRALGVKAPGSYLEFSKMTSITEAFPAADDAHDEPTADLLTQRMQIHEKNAWMLRSMLAQD
jgi:starvation-inducible DNA-binding protein